MKVLIADDDVVFLRMLNALLLKWGYDVVSCSNGSEVWQILQGENAPRLVILDWMMPGLNGVEICRKVREMRKAPYTYIILLTAKDNKKDIIEGMESGADDYVIKPFHAEELKVRLRAGSRIIDLQEELITKTAMSS